MGLLNVRMSRKNHPMPIMTERSPRAAAKYSDEGYPKHPAKPQSVHSMDPGATWPAADISKITPPPKSYARDGKEGPRRGRQADKSSSSK